MEKTEYTKTKIAGTMALLNKIGLSEQPEVVRQMIEADLKLIAKTAISEARQKMDSLLFDFDYEL